jgi:hypothetical protein
MQTAAYSELEERQISEDLAVGCLANIPATLRNTIASNTLSRFVSSLWFGECIQTLLSLRDGRFPEDPVQVDLFKLALSNIW